MSNIRLGRDGALTFTDLLPKLLKNAAVFQEQERNKIAQAPEIDIEYFENSFNTKRHLKDGDDSPKDFNEIHSTDTRMNLVPNQNIKQIKSKSELWLSNWGDDKNYELNLNGSNLNTQRENTFTWDKPKESNGTF